MATETSFLLHRGHLTKRADTIAAKHGAWHVNYTDSNDEKRGWFSTWNRGEPHDRRAAEAVARAIDAAGGIEQLTRKR